MSWWPSLQSIFFYDKNGSKLLYLLLLCKNIEATLVFGGEGKQCQLNVDTCSVSPMENHVSLAEDLMWYTNYYPPTHFLPSFHIQANNFRHPPGCVAFVCPFRSVMACVSFNALYSFVDSSSMWLFAELMKYIYIKQCRMHPTE